MFHGRGESRWLTVLWTYIHNDERAWVFNGTHVSRGSAVVQAGRRDEGKEGEREAGFQNLVKSLQRPQSQLKHSST